MSEFNLKYIHRINGQEIKVKRVTITDYCYLEPGTGKRIQTTKAKLSKDYKPCPKNEIEGRGITRAVRGKRRGTRTDSKAFQEYLKGKSA